MCGIIDMGRLRNDAIDFQYFEVFALQQFVHALELDVETPVVPAFDTSADMVHEPFHFLIDQMVAIYKLGSLRMVADDRKGESLILWQYIPHVFPVHA